IALRITRDDFQRLRVGLWRAIAQRVYWVCMAPGFRKNFIERIPRVCRELSQLSTVRQQSIRSQNSGATGVGYHGKLWSFGTRLLAQHLSHVEQLGNIGNAQDSAAAKCRLENFVGTGQSAGVRCRRFARCFTLSRLDDNDRLSQGHLARRRKKIARVADGLHINQNAGGVRIVAVVIDQVAPTHIYHRANRNKSAEAHILPAAPVKNRRTQRTALAEESQVSRQSIGLSEGGVESGARIHDSKTIRADHAQLSRSQSFLDLLFPLQPFSAEFGKTSGDDNRTTYSGVHTFLQDGCNRLCRSNDHGKINVLTDGCNVGITAYSQNVTAAGIHRKYRRPEGLVQQIS